MLVGVLMLVAALASQLDATVTVTPLSGPPLSGQLVRLSAADTVIHVDGEAHTIAARELRKIDFAASQPPTPPPIQVELTDGSLVRCTSFTVSSSAASLVLAGEQTVTIPTSHIHRVLLQELKSEEERGLWDELSQENLGTDILVFRPEAEGARLDSLDVVLHDITEVNVELTFQEQSLKPARARIVGITYLHPSVAAANTSTDAKETVLCSISDTSGSTWRAASLELKGDMLHWTTPTRVEMKAPLALIRQLDYAAGNLVYLSDMRPESESWEPYIASRVARELLAARYAPRRNESFGGGPLMLAGTAYTTGLALHSRTELVYRLTGEFSRFRTLAGLDDRVRDAEIQASVRLVISGDDKVLFDQNISVADGAKDLDLDVSGIRRLRILVDFGDDLDVADFLNLCEARLIK